MVRKADSTDHARDAATVMTYRLFAARLRVVAAHHGLTNAEAIKRFLQPYLDREYRKILTEVGKEADPETEKS